VSDAYEYGFTDGQIVLAKKFAELYSRIDQLTAERDEARREVCFMQHLSGFFAGDFALSRGWDCFKDKVNYDFPNSVKEFRDLWCDYSNKLKNELDEVRALYCEKLSPADPQKVAEKWRWDCFDNGKNAWLLPESKRTMDRLVELGEELEANHNNQKYRVTDGE
jgi:hypothetical protein